MTASPQALRGARGLGWFSMGLGATQLASPRAVTRWLGLPDSKLGRAMMLVVGAREIAAGVGLVARPRQARWAWARVGGDVMDLGLLGASLLSPCVDARRAVAAMAAVAGVTAFDVITALRLGGARAAMKAAGPVLRATAGKPIEVRKTITINRSPEEVYGFYRDVHNLPRFMAHLQSVEVLDAKRSRWKARGPAGTTVCWDAEITDDRPGESLAWRALEGADVANDGVVRFVAAPGGRGTEVHVTLRYRPPGGRIGKAVAKLFGEEPGQQLEGDLRRLKQVIETGEVTRSDANVHGGGMHPARPPSSRAARKARRSGASDIVSGEVR